VVDVIICLGDFFNELKKVKNMELRTKKSVKLYKQHKAKKIIFTGGFRTRKDISEAEYMENIAIKFNIPRKDIILEERANTTIGNAYYCNKIMKKKNFKSAIIITSPHHIKRAKYIFEKIIPSKKLEFVECKHNLRFFEAIPCHITEIKDILKLKILGINLTKK
tara:strand:+ start:2212 stop:2703 length:492 start_codon:yes stop_codon:yes gene_type:complete